MCNTFGAAQLNTAETERLQIDDRDRLVVLAAVHFGAATDRHSTSVSEEAERLPELART